MKNVVQNTTQITKIENTNPLKKMVVNSGTSER